MNEDVTKTKVQEMESASQTKEETEMIPDEALDEVAGGYRHTYSKKPYVAKEQA